MAQAQQPGQTDANQADTGERVEVLPSGGEASIRPGKGRDIRKATRMLSVADRSDGICIQMAMIAVLCTIDGRGLTFEDVLELDSGDVWFLMGKLGAAGKAPPSMPST